MGSSYIATCGAFGNGGGLVPCSTCVAYQYGAMGRLAAMCLQISYVLPFLAAVPLFRQTEYIIDPNQSTPPREGAT